MKRSIVVGLIGLIMGIAYLAVSQGLTYCLLMGLLLGSYIALVEPDKYAAPSNAEWIAVEGIASAAQFTPYGPLLGWVHAKMNEPI